MNFYGSLDSFLEYSLQASSDYFAFQAVEQKDKQSDSLEYLFQDKVDSLSEILAQIDRDIKSRNDLSKDVIEQIDQHYRYIKTKYYELQQWMFGHNRWVEQRRSALERQLDALDQEKRQEQIQCWRDIAQLTREFRDWFKQYCDLMQRIKIIIPERKTIGSTRKSFTINSEVRESTSKFFWQLPH
jgi:hypothetical protein